MRVPRYGPQHPLVLFPRIPKKVAPYVWKDSQKDYKETAGNLRCTTRIPLGSEFRGRFFCSAMSAGDADYHILVLIWRRSTQMQAITY